MSQNPVPLEGYVSVISYDSTGLPSQTQTITHFPNNRLGQVDAFQGQVPLLVQTQPIQNIQPQQNTLLLVPTNGSVPLNVPMDGHPHTLTHTITSFKCQSTQQILQQPQQQSYLLLTEVPTQTPGLIQMPSEGVIQVQPTFDPSHVNFIEIQPQIQPTLSLISTTPASGSVELVQVPNTVYVANVAPNQATPLILCLSEGSVDLQNAISVTPAQPQTLQLPSTQVLVNTTTGTNLVSEVDQASQAKSWLSDVDLVTRAMSALARHSTSSTSQVGNNLPIQQLHLSH